MNETHSILQRMRELAVQSANDTNNDTDRKEIQKEINELIDEIDRIAGNTEFNTQTLLDGSFNGTFHIGANADQKISLAISSMETDNLGTTAKVSTLKLDLSTATTGGVIDQGSADSAITVINEAIEQVSAERSKLGAYQNRLEHTINNLGTSAENLTAAESRIRDVDMAKEMMEFTKNNILTQASQAMLAQANQAPQGVLQLLR